MVTALSILIIFATTLSGALRTTTSHAFGDRQSPSVGTLGPSSSSAGLSPSKIFMTSSDLPNQIDGYKSSTPTLKDGPSALRTTFESRQQVFQIKEIRLDDDIMRASALCIDVFFGVGKNFWEKQKREQLFRLHFNDLIKRRSENVVITLRNEANAVVGVGELLSWNLDQRSFDRFLQLTPNEIEFASLDQRADMSIKNPTSPEGAKVNLAKIGNVAIDPEYRRMGLGSVIINSLVERAYNMGYDAVFLQTEEDNRDARKFYRKIGFQEIFINPNAMQYDMDGWVLKMKRIPHVVMMVRCEKYLSLQS